MPCIKSGSIIWRKKTIKIGFEILEGIGTSLSPSPYHGEKTGPKTVTQCNGLKYQKPPAYIKETKTQNGKMLSTKVSFYVGHKTILPFARQKKIPEIVPLTLKDNNLAISSLLSPILFVSPPSTKRLVNFLFNDTSLTFLKWLINKYPKERQEKTVKVK